MASALSTLGAVMQFIERGFGPRLSVHATREQLRRWGATPQKPIQRAHEQRPEAVRQWLDLEDPAIERHASAEGAEIHGAARRRGLLAPANRRCVGRCWASFIAALPHSQPTAQVKVTDEAQG
jgi:hypothetical protein